MPTAFSTIESAALQLSPEDRVKLADHLLASVDAQADIEGAWAAEIDRRLAEIESGSAALVPLQDAVARARQALS